jgi:anti-sigma factor RsiW
MWRCFLYRKHLSGYFDGALSEQKRERVECHVARCPSCSRILTEIQGLSPILSKLEVPEPPSDLTAQIMATAYSVKQLEKRGSAPADVPRFTFSLRDWQPRTAIVAALIIGLVMGGLMGWDLGSRSTGHAVEIAVHDGQGLDNGFSELTILCGPQKGSIEAVTLDLLKI